MITKVYLLSVPLDKDYKHTFYFANAGVQHQYFESRKKHSFTDFTYQRKDNTMRIPLDYDTAIKCNYVMYQNMYESTKWYYAFITDYQWSDEDTTTITIQTDVMQTYAFDYTVQTSFVEREHCADDTIGANTFPENLECGDYVCIDSVNTDDTSNYCYVLGVTEFYNSAEKEFVKVSGNEYDGVYSGVRYLHFYRDNIKGLNEWIQFYADKGKTDAITCLFAFPKAFLEGEGDTIYVKAREYPKTITKRLAIKEYEGYKPKNNKLYTYPYRYLLVSNNNGGSAIYKFEEFNNVVNNSIGFKISGCLTPGGSIRLVPNNYKNIEINHEEGLNLGKYPICNWTSDVYTNWLTQNSVNIGLNMVSGLAQTVAGVGVAVATGGAGIAVGGSLAVSGVSTISNQLAQIHQMSFTPPQSKGNTNCGDIITADYSNSFWFYQMKIKDEYLKIIDEYFEMFGYKCNRVKVPEKNHREHWWFTKTIDVNITGDIPQNDLETIKNCYNVGVTFWKDDIKNYNRTNGII